MSCGAVLNQNIDHLFTFQFDPLKMVLSDIVREIQEHREIIKQMRGEYSENQDIELENVDNGEEVNSQQNQEFDMASLDNKDRVNTESMDESLDKKSSLPINEPPFQKKFTIQSQIEVVDQEEEEQKEQNLINDENYDKVQEDITTIPLKDMTQSPERQQHSRNSTRIEQKKSSIPFSSIDRKQQQVRHSVNITPSKKKSSGTQQKYMQPPASPVLTKKHPLIAEIFHKLDLMESQMKQKELIQRQENLILKQQMEDKLNEQINSIWGNFKDLQQKIQQQEEAQILARFSMQSRPSNINLDNIKGGENQEELIQVIQGILNKQRKDMHEKMTSQLQFLESKLKHEMASLQNYVQLCTQQDDDKQYANSLENGQDSSRNQGLDNQKSVDNTKTSNNHNMNATFTQKDELHVPSPSHQRRMTVASPEQAHIVKVPPKILNEIRFLKSSVDKHDKLVSEIGEKVFLNDRILSRINDYYENNLRNVQIKSLIDAIKEIEKVLETKASTLEVKKVIASIRKFYLNNYILDECNDKFNWLEERYKEERKSQQMITDNLAANIKKQRQRVDALESKNAYFDKMLLQIKDELREKMRGENNWMGNFGSQNNNEMIRMQFDSQEENMKQLEKKMESFQKIIEQGRQEDKALYKRLQDLIDSKVGIQKLHETEEKMERLIDKVISSMNKRFLEKKEIKKQAINTEKQLNFFYELLVLRMNDIEASDPMIAKKPLGGWSCLNCSKSLSNMHGNMADFQINKKFPNRDPQARMAKVQGFSKLYNQYSNMSDDEQKFKSVQKSKGNFKPTSIFKEHEDFSVPQSSLALAMTTPSLNVHSQTTMNKEMTRNESKNTLRQNMEEANVRQVNQSEQAQLSKRSESGLPSLKQKRE